MKTSHTHTHMKSPYLFLLSLMLLLSGMIIPSQAFAQHEELLDKTWYFYKLEVDGVEHLYSSIGLPESDASTMEILWDDRIDLYGCPGWGCSLEFDFIENENKIILDSMICLAMDPCFSYSVDENFPEYDMIASYYFGFYRDSYNSIIEYDLQTIEGVEYLMFTDNNEDKLYYTAVNLSVSDFDVLRFILSPNPVQDQLYIRLAELPAKTSLEVYDIHGKLLKKIAVSEIETHLDVSEYASGMYFIKMREEAGNMQTVKFVKQ